LSGLALLQMLASIILRYEPVRAVLMTYLRPSDIIAFTTALGLKISRNERAHHMQLLCEIFSSTCWISDLASRGMTATILGKDLHYLDIAIRSWNYSALPRRMRLIIIVQNDLLRTKIQTASHFKRNSISMEYVLGQGFWTTDSLIPPVQDAPAENCMPFPLVCGIFCQQRRITIDALWTEWLFDAPNHLEMERDSRTWYINAHESHPTVEITEGGCRGHRDIYSIVKRLGGENKLLAVHSKSIGRTFVLSTERGLLE
jgi:hypothetical protein